jgi:hypothetical protein
VNVAIHVTIEDGGVVVDARRKLPRTLCKSALPLPHPAHTTNKAKNNTSPHIIAHLIQF